jgi:FkbM family methyltransferase
MKDLIRNLLQKLLGFKNYLYYFSLYSIFRIERGKYERSFLHFVKLINNKGIVLDIGANIGITATSLARHLPQTEVHAIEPIAENFGNLERIKEHFKLSNVKLLNVALGNQHGMLKMIMPIRGESKMQGLSKVFVAGSTEKGIIYDVPVNRLDDLYPTETNIAAIKIDVENFEFEVLKGGLELLKRNMPPIYCELWDNEIRTSVFELLANIGYTAYAYDEHRDYLIPIMAGTQVDDNNFFFLK